MSATSGIDILVRKGSPEKLEWSASDPFAEFDAAVEADRAVPAVLFEVEKVALTANSITYVVIGDSPLQYFQHFPPKEGQDPAVFGRMPAWGIGRVVRSSHPDLVPLGERFYGYFPFSSHVVVRPKKVKASGFTDGSKHREELPAIYMDFVKLKGDSFLKASGGNEDFMIVFRPLFLTSWLLADLFLHSEPGRLFGADAVVITSASSKTSLGLASALCQATASSPKPSNGASGSNEDSEPPAKKARVAGVEPSNLIGLTSSRNLSFVKSTGLYGAVMTYDEVLGSGTLPAPLDGSRTIAIVDIAGNAKVLESLRRGLGSAVKHVSLVGLTHHESLGDSGIGEPPKDDTGAAVPKWFFAPEQAETVVSRLGGEKFMEAVGESWAQFLPKAQKWMQIARANTKSEVEKVYGAVVKGGNPPNNADVISLSSPEARSSLAKL